MNNNNNNIRLYNNDSHQQKPKSDTETLEICTRHV